MQGSTQVGVDSPMGGVLLTSNIKKNERLVYLTFYVIIISASLYKSDLSFKSRDCC